MTVAVPGAAARRNVDKNSATGSRPASAPTWAEKGPEAAAA